MRRQERRIVTSQTLVPWRKPAALATIETEAALAVLDERADAYRDAARAESTRDVYQRRRAAWAAWCEEHARESFPADWKTVDEYVAFLAARGLRHRTIVGSCAAIRAEHFDAGLFDPTSHPKIRLALTGIRNEQGRSPQKAALAIGQLSAMCSALPADALGARDRVVLLLGFAGAFRRAPLTALQVGDVEMFPDAARIFIGRDKQDQAGKGRYIVVPEGRHIETCPVTALRTWLGLIGRSSGPLLVRLRGGRRRTDGAESKPALLTERQLRPGAVAMIVKARAVAVGIDPKDLAGHSLRSGFMTAAAKAGKRLDKMMAQSGHAKTDTAMGYIRDAEMFDDANAAKGIGL